MYQIVKFIAHIIPNLFNMIILIMFYMKLTQQDMARILEIDPRTLRNWRKNKPKLYEIIIRGFNIDIAIDEAKKNYENLKECIEIK